MKRIFLSAALAFLATSALAQTKISELGAAGPLTGVEEVPIVQDATTYKTTTADIADLAAAAVIQTGTFTISWSGGCTVAQDQDFAYTKIGNVVILTMLEGFTCTSNGASLTATAGQWPALLRPATVDVATGPVGVIDNGTNGNFPGCIRIQPNGGVNAARTSSGGQWCLNSWTASGTKGISINPAVFLGTNTAMYSLN